MVGVLWLSGAAPLASEGGWRGIRLPGDHNMRTLAIVAAAFLHAGCSTVPTTAAIQKTAVGGGFIATGSVAMVGGVVVAVGGAIVGGSVPPTQAESFNQSLLLAAGLPLLIGGAQLVGGAILLNQGGHEIDAAAKPTVADRVRPERLPRRVAPVRKPVAKPENPLWGPLPDEDENEDR